MLDSAERERYRGHDTADALIEDSYLSELVRHVLGGWIAMLYAKGDESYSGSPRTSNIYVVAGYIGSAGQWYDFDWRWRKSMRALGIEHIGCHASACRSGKKEYEDFSEQKRDEIQHRLIADIADSHIFGCVASSDLDGWRSRREMFSQFLGKNQRKFNEPHVIVHRQCVLLMLNKTAEATKEPIAFVFDRNKDAGGRAREWYHLDLKNKKLDAPNMMGPHYRSRLGPIVEDDRMKVLGLQAADILANSAYRYLSGIDSWQWGELIAPKRITVLPFDESYWQSVEDHFKAEAQK
jgi:hypothetical protein